MCTRLGDLLEGNTLTFLLNPCFPLKKIHNVPYMTACVLLRQVICNTELKFVIMLITSTMDILGPKIIYYQNTIDTILANFTFNFANIYFLLDTDLNTRLYANNVDPDTRPIHTT